jgi:hypothetical protein
MAGHTHSSLRKHKDNIFVLYGGFNRDCSVASAFTYTLDTADPTATWQKVDDIPISQGLTHGAHVRIGTKIYNCGGYVGGHPGLHTTTCMVYDQSKPLGQRWTTITPLPEGRMKLPRIPGQPFPTRTPILAITVAVPWSMATCSASRAVATVASTAGPKWRRRTATIWPRVCGKKTPLFRNCELAANMAPRAMEK